MSLLRYHEKARNNRTKNTDKRDSWMGENRKQDVKRGRYKAGEIIGKVILHVTDPGLILITAYGPVSTVRTDSRVESGLSSEFCLNVPKHFPYHQL